MSWIQTIRQKPQEYKLRLLWTIVLIVAVLLLAAWIVFSRIGNKYSTASQFISGTVKDIQQNGQEMYKENK